MADQRSHEVSIGHLVGSERVGGVVQRSMHRGGRTSVERMGERHRGLAQPVTQPAECRLTEERRGQYERMNHGTDVMAESGRSGCLGSATPTGCPGSLDHRHREAGGSQGHGGGQAVGARTDHDRIDRAHGWVACLGNGSTGEVLPSVGGKQAARDPGHGPTPTLLVPTTALVSDGAKTTRSAT